jgi:ATP synthase F0 subunit c
MVEISGADLVTVSRYLSAALAIGLGAVGAGVGWGLAAGDTVEGIRLRPSLQRDLSRTLFIGGAIAESSTIYALVVASVLIFVIGSPEHKGAITGADLALAAKYLGSGLAIGFGAIGAGLGLGAATGRAILGMARQPFMQNALLRTMIIGMAIAESTTIYALVISILLIFVV